MSRTKSLNESVSNLISARNAALSRIPQDQRKAIIGLLPRLTAIAAGAAGGATAAGPVGGIVGALGAAAAEKAITSPAVTTRAARFLSNRARPSGLFKILRGV